MGGLHDSTNLFSPLAVICPSIGLDHQAVLGNTHAEIATEKAGVLKNGASFIYATDRTDVRDVFKQKANEEGSKTYELGKDFTAEGSSHSFDFIYKYEKYCSEKRNDKQCTLTCKHKRNNAYNEENNAEFIGFFAGKHFAKFNCNKNVHRKCSLAYFTE